jgi:ABC-type transport system involved in multi-copper enzyme maturation permease subunit
VIRLVRSEWTKLFTTRVWIGLLLGAVVLVGGLTALFTGLAGQQGNNGQQGLPPVADPQFQQVALSQIANASVFVVILGIIGMTQEYRHRTATPTFLTTPRRGQVVLAKLLAYLFVGIPFAAVATGVDLLVLEIYARARGVAPSLAGDNLRVIAGAGTALVIYAIIGVGVGALLRNQVAAVVGIVLYRFLIEGILSAIPKVQNAYPYLPGGATASLLQGQDTGNGAPFTLLSPWVGGLLLLGYGLIFAILGSMLTVRRDVT